MNSPVQNLRAFLEAFVEQRAGEAHAARVLMEKHADWQIVAEYAEREIAAARRILDDLQIIERDGFSSSLQWPSQAALDAWDGAYGVPSNARALYHRVLARERRMS